MCRSSACTADRAITEALKRSGVMRKIIEPGREQFSTDRRDRSEEARPEPLPDFFMLMADGTRVAVNEAAMQERVLQIKERLIREGKPLIV